MNAWLAFWEGALVVAGVTFAAITGVVIVLGFGDLRRMIADLSKAQPNSDALHGGEGERTHG